MFSNKDLNLEPDPEDRTSTVKKIDPRAIVFTDQEEETKMSEPTRNQALIERISS